MTGYTKLFGTIVASTIWREDKETKIVWITMLAMANKSGIVEASIPGLADMSRVSIPEAQKALECLMSPDEFSRTKDHEGRRIQEIDGGWQILNHAKYRAKMGADERREYFRIKKQEERAREKNASNPRQQKSKTVNDSGNASMTVPPVTQSETQSETDSKAKTEPAARTSQPSNGRSPVGDDPPDTDQVLDFAKNSASPLRTDVAMAWMDSRTRDGWQTKRDGHLYPIFDWRSDLRAFARSYNQNEAERKAKNGGDKPKGKIATGFGLK